MIGMDIAWPESLAVWANDTSSIQQLCVLALLQQTWYHIYHIFSGIPSVPCTCSSQSISIAQAGLKFDLVLGLQE